MFPFGLEVVFFASQLLQGHHDLELEEIMPFLCRQSGLIFLVVIPFPGDPHPSRGAPRRPKAESRPEPQD